jgi:hypothetical protein
VPSEPVEYVAPPPAQQPQQPPAPTAYQYGQPSAQPYVPYQQQVPYQQPAGQPEPAPQGFARPPSGPSPVLLTPDQIAARTTPIQWQVEDAGAAGRRRRLLLGVLVGAGVLVVALLVVVSLALTNGQTTAPVAKPAPTPTPTPSQRPSPSLDDAQTDTAPTTLDALLPDEAVMVGGRTYQPRLRKASSDCAASAGRAYASAMRTELCGQLLRATYTGPRGIDVTVGIAVFDTKPQVDHVVAALRQAGDFNEPFLLPMPAAGMNAFTVAAGPLSTARPVGRYLVLAVAAYADGHAFTRNDVTANHAVSDMLDHAEASLRARTSAPNPAGTMGG